ncbi:hypothetical protein LTS02_007179 [Friedmanniomyces endolithicus]|nr:hypothetical protein LTS02_007179 [Friedmanniomyces endolithicus]KAK1089020.1 hypothetical protein LTR33_000267 [Friedmanniomyces endolithicus]
MTPRSMQEAALWHQQNYGQSYSQRLHGQQGYQPQAFLQSYGYGGGGNQAFHGFVEDGSIHSGSGGSGGGRSNRGGGGRSNYAGAQDSGPYMMSGGLGPASGGNRAFQSSGGNGGEFGGGRPNGGGGRNSKSLETPIR